MYGPFFSLIFSNPSFSCSPILWNGIKSFGLLKPTFYPLRLSLWFPSAFGSARQNHVPIAILLGRANQQFTNQWPGIKSDVTFAKSNPTPRFLAVLNFSILNGLLQEIWYTVENANTADNLVGWIQNMQVRIKQTRKYKQRFHFPRSAWLNLTHSL